MDSHSTILFNPDLHKECITSASGNSMEYIELNGHGGFYYNFNTGEVKLNVIKPLKEYLWLYFLAKNGNEIPSDW